MVTNYHSHVTKSIIFTGQELIKLRKIRKVFRGEEKPLSIVEYHSKHVINYKPDVYFLLRNNKKMIFEVLDSEEEKQDIIIADIIRSFLVENVEAIIFVFSGNKNVEYKIIESLVTISKGLVSKGIPEKELPIAKSGALVVEKELDEINIMNKINIEYFDKK